MTKKTRIIWRNWFYNFQLRQTKKSTARMERPIGQRFCRTMYFGEYPLSFAVCMNQPDLFRLLVAQKANLNAQDTNGNTALHLCVIHEKTVSIAGTPWSIDLEQLHAGHDEDGAGGRSSAQHRQQTEPHAFNTRCEACQEEGRCGER